MKKRLWVTLSSVSSLLVILLGLLGYQGKEGMVGTTDAARRRGREESEFKDGTWYDRTCRADEAKYRAEDKSPLHIFLGTEFGTYQHARYDRFVRVREGFGPFGWIRSLGYRQYRVEGAQTYHVFNGPEKLVDLAQELGTVFSNVYGVVFSRTNSADLVYGMTGNSGFYDVSVLVRGPVVATNVCEGATAYELRFSVANPNLEHDAKFDDLTRSVETWRRAFAPIVIRPETESDPAAWDYRPPLEPTTEEQLMHAIKMKDQKHVPWFAGMPGVLTSARGNRHYSGCTEAEADEYSVDDKFFYRWCSEAEKDRLSELSTRPRRMRQRKPGEKRSHRSGYIDGRILAGDTVQWFDANRDLRKGTVVGKDEGGEYVEEFKCYIKTTHIEYMAMESDWLPSPMTSNYNSRVQSVYAQMKQLEERYNAFYEGGRLKAGVTVTNKLDLLREFMDDFRAQNEPGEHPVVNYSILEMPTKAAARAAVERNEVQAKNRWLSSVNRAIEDIISRYLRWGICRHEERRHRVCADCRKLITEHCALSPYDVYLLIYGWPMKGFPESRSRIVAPYRPLGAPVSREDLYYGFSISTEESAENVLRALGGESLTNDVEFALSAWTAIGSAIESPEQLDKFRLMQCLADVVAKCGTAKTCAWLSGRVIIEYGETSYLPWEFAYCLSDVIAKNGVKNDEQHYCASGAEGGPPGHMEKLSDRIIKWTKERFSSDLFKELKKKSEDPRGKTVWEERFPQPLKVEKTI